MVRIDIERTTTHVCLWRQGMKPRQVCLEKAALLKKSSSVRLQGTSLFLAPWVAAGSRGVRPTTVPRPSIRCRQISDPPTPQIGHKHARGCIDQVPSSVGLDGAAAVEMMSRKQFLSLVGWMQQTGGNKVQGQIVFRRGRGLADAAPRVSTVVQTTKPIL